MGRAVAHEGGTASSSGWAAGAQSGAAVQGGGCEGEEEDKERRRPDSPPLYNGQLALTQLSSALAPRFYPPPSDHPHQPAFPLRAFIVDKMAALQPLTRNLPGIVRDPLVALFGQVRQLSSSRTGGNELLR